MACSGQKLAHAAPAQQLYCSQLFRKAAAWATANGDAWLILSAKHFVVDPAQVLEPYDVTLKNMSAAERRVWSERVRGFLDPQHRYTVLAGNDYCGWIGPRHQVARPLQGMGIGEQLSWLKNNL